MSEKDYPKADRHNKGKVVYVRYPVKEDGQYFGAEVLPIGYRISMCALPFKTEQECKKACDDCNRYNQYTPEQCELIISASMQLSLA
ncbi:hypothetical protein ACWPKS_15805 [Coraliomargarita sp. W4R72]